MLDPIRCFTCGKILGNKYRYYTTKLESIQKGESIIDTNASSIKTTPECKILDELNLKRYCCRRMMLGHINLIDDM